MNWAIYPEVPEPLLVYTQPHPASPERVRWRVYLPTENGKMLIGTGAGFEREVRPCAWRAYRRARDLLVWRSRLEAGTVEARMAELDLVATVQALDTGARWSVAVDGEIVAAGHEPITADPALDARHPNDAAATLRRRAQDRAQHAAGAAVLRLLP